MQIRHLRLLWLKQLIAISEEEGVAIRLFRIRVTYVNIIQVRARRSRCDLSAALCANNVNSTQSLLWAASLIALAAY